jgi:deazaflavin-dependent oxidoreductase (nitroreductase family)
MALNGEYVPSTTEWVRDQVERIEKSGGTEGTTMRGVPVVVLTSKGAKTGALRKHPVMRVEHDGKYAAVASVGGAPQHPSWYFNLRAEPRVEVQDGTVKREYTAREVTGDEKAQWWERAVAIWPSYDDYQARTTRDIPVFVLEPTR